VESWVDEELRWGRGLKWEGRKVVGCIICVEEVCQQDDVQSMQVYSWTNAIHGG